MRIALYILLALLGLAILVTQALSVLGGPVIGFTHEVWLTDSAAGHHSNSGVVLDGRLFIFVEREQHPLSTRWWSDTDRWDAAGSPPQFTVSGSRVQRDWEILGARYSYRAKTTEWQGQYHLFTIGPLALFVVSLAVLGWSALGVMEWLRRPRQQTGGRCRECGYDLRGGHERCPECGTPCATI